MKLYSNKSIDELKWVGAPISSLIFNGTLSKTQGARIYTYDVDAIAEYQGTSLSTLIMFGKFTLDEGTKVLSFSSLGNGSVTATVSGEPVTSPYPVEPTATVVITATADSGYQFGSFTGLPEGATVVANVATFSMPDANVTVTASFAQVALNCLKFSGPTEEHTTSIVVGTSAEESSEFFRNPAWDATKESAPMYCWALPKGGVYTDTLTPSTTTHVWGKVGDTWTDLSALAENPVSIYLVRTDSFDTLTLRAGANVEISDNGTTWTAWQPEGSYIEADVVEEEKTVSAFGERYADGDKTISGTVYYCWISKPYDIYTLATMPSTGATVYAIDEGVATSVGTVTNVAATGYSHDVSNGVVYVRAKTGSTPLFGFSGLFAKVEGPVMSLVDYSNTSTAVLANHQFARTVYGGAYAEAGLFYDVTSSFLENSSAPFLSDASGLIMPSAAQVTSASAYALSMMFNNCLTLGGDKLPALTTPAIAQGLYDCFCFGCISIKHLPASLLANTFTSTPGVAPYSYMFSQCMSLEDIPSGFLNTQNLGGAFYSEETWGYQSAYTEMFSNCYSLKSVPSDLLPATTLTPCCYGHMFMNCVSLENAPALPAQTLASGCYKGMFEGCSSLEECPDLAATILPSEVVIEGVNSARGCYQRMFMGCSSILTTPALTALNLTPYCYSEMFEDCSALYNATCLATDITAEQCTASWLSGVADSGSFHRNSSTWAYWTIGVSGIPEGWTVDPAKPAANLKVLYPYSGTYTHLSFVRYPYGDETANSTKYYAWAIADADFDTVYTTTLWPTASSQLYYKEQDTFIDSSATVEEGVFTNKVSVVIQNYASGVAANGITYTLSEGSYTNSVQSFTGAITGDATVTVSVSGSGWKWSDDDSTTSPRTFTIGSDGMFAQIAQSVAPVVRNLASYHEGDYGKQARVRERRAASDLEWNTIPMSFTMNFGYDTTVPEGTVVTATRDSSHDLPIGTAGWTYYTAYSIPATETDYGTISEVYLTKFNPYVGPGYVAFYDSDQSWHSYSSWEIVTISSEKDSPLHFYGWGHREDDPTAESAMCYFLTETPTSSDKGAQPPYESIESCISYACFEALFEESAFGTGDYKLITVTNSDSEAEVDWGYIRTDGVEFFVSGAVLNGHTASIVANYPVVLTSWNDGDTNNPRTITVTANANYTYTASAYTNIPVYFKNNQDTVTGGTFAVSVNGDIQTWDFGATSGTNIVMSATPNTGYVFLAWNDESTENPHTVSLSEEYYVNAEFAKQVTITFGSDGNGSVTAVDGEGNPLTSPAVVLEDSNMTLTATPNTGYAFNHWTDSSTPGEEFEDNPFETVIGNTDATITAHFVSG